MRGEKKNLQQNISPSGTVVPGGLITRKAFMSLSSIPYYNNNITITITTTIIIINNQDSVYVAVVISSPCESSLVHFINAELHHVAANTMGLYVCMSNVWPATWECEVTPWDQAGYLGM